MARSLAELRERLESGGFPDDEASPLVRLFARGEQVAAASIRDVLGPELVDSCSASGLMAEDGEHCMANYRLAVHHDLLFAVDPPEAPGQFNALQVLPPSGSTNTLVKAMHRTPCGSALELGTGSGALALLMAMHAARVVATDTNPRAIEMARLSAALNGIGNVETRLGSWFEPLSGEKFDQIISNPPFVISPESRRVYRDSGLEGDAVCRLVIGGMPAHLNSGGVGQVLVNWTVSDGQESFYDWVDDCDCDVLIQRLQTFELEEYARNWLGDRADGPELADWLAYYRRLGIDAIKSGIITLTRR